MGEEVRMDENLNTLLSADPRYRDILQTIADEPYIEHQALAEKSRVPAQELEELLATLTEKLVVLELASQADSSIESRVPKKVYMLNPEREEEIRGLF
jgi:hypothetical protein